jgi:YHS domain-containing protein
MIRSVAALRVLAIGLALAAPLAAPTAGLAAPPVYTAPFSKLAVGGYDPVAYFTEGRPVKGEARFTTQWGGVEYRFASADNLARFKADPAAYAPQYGGYCAWAVSNGYTAKGDPQAWKVVGGRLFLNYDQTVQKRWAADIAGHIARADRNWPAVLQKK